MYLCMFNQVWTEALTTVWIIWWNWLMVSFSGGSIAVWGVIVLARINSIYSLNMVNTLRMRYFGLRIILKLNFFGLQKTDKDIFYLYWKFTSRYGWLSNSDRQSAVRIFRFILSCIEIFDVKHKIMRTYIVCRMCFSQINRISNC